MSESKALYRVQFICHSERYEVYVREVNQGQLFGFIEIADFVWDNHTALIVDPSHEKLKSEFADVRQTLIPMHQVLRIDQVKKRGLPASRIWAATSPPSPAPSIPNVPSPYLLLMFRRGETSISARCRPVQGSINSRPSCRIRWRNQ